MKKLLALVLVLAMAPLASAAIEFVAPAEALPGSTIDIQLVANAGEEVKSALLGVISDNGAGGTVIPGAWDTAFTTSDPGYVGGGFGLGYNPGDLLGAQGAVSTGTSATGTLYSYQYTLSSAAEVCTMIDFSLLDVGAAGWISKVKLADADIVPAGFSVHVVPEPMSLALLGLGGLFLRRRK